MCADLSKGHEKDQRTASLKPDFDCPSPCLIKKLKNSSLYQIQENGSLTLQTTWKDQVDLHSYCATYDCHYDVKGNTPLGWKPVIEACVCPKESIFEELHQKDYQDIPTCCPDPPGHAVELAERF